MDIILLNPQSYYLFEVFGLLDRTHLAGLPFPKTRQTGALFLLQHIHTQISTTTQRTRPRNQPGGLSSPPLALRKTLRQSTLLSPLLPPLFSAAAPTIFSVPKKRKKKGKSVIVGGSSHFPTASRPEQDAMMCLQDRNHMINLIRDPKKREK